MMTDDKSNLLSTALRKRIDEWNLRYPPEHKRSGILEALRWTQEENGGYLTVDLMDAVADFLQIPRIAAYEVATFYTLYQLNPVGKHVICLCTNISCSLNGAEKLVDYVKERLGIGFNETTADGKFTLKEVECLGACITPPVAQVGKEYYVNLSREKIDELLASLE